MIRFSKIQRVIATSIFVAVALFWVHGLDTGQVIDLAMEVEKPVSGTILPPNQSISMSLRFDGGIVERVECDSGGHVRVHENRANIRVQSPSNQGLWVIECVAKSATGSRHVFKPAYLVGGKNSSALGTGALILPTPFFSSGCSTFVPIMEEALNSVVIPQIERNFGTERRQLVDREYLRILQAKVDFENFKIGHVDLEMNTSAPSGIVIEVAMNELSADGFARFEVGAAARLPGWARRLLDLNLEGRISGQGKLRAVVDVSVGDDGQIRTDLRPGSFEARFHHFCFDTICFEIESKAEIQQMISERLAPMFGSGATNQLNQVLNQSMARTELRFPVFNRVERARLKPLGFGVLKSSALAFHWAVQFVEAEKKEPRILSWAGKLPEWNSPRPHVLISDRVVNRVLSRIWLRALRQGVPSKWIDSVNRGLRSSGYHISRLEMGAPPVLAPGFGKDGLRLILNDVRVRIGSPGEAHHHLRVHAELPIRLMPTADGEAITLVGAYHYGDLQHEGADRTKDDGRLYVECLSSEGEAGSEACSSKTTRFQRLVDVALSMAQGLRAQIRIPVTGPNVPGPSGTVQRLKFSRVQLVPNAPGWLVLEANY